MNSRNCFRQSEPAEGFKPIPVKSPTDHLFLFKFRCLVDLQLGSIVNRLVPALAQVTGSVLDVGAGHSPWRAWLPATTSYQGIDVEYANKFGIPDHRQDIMYYDGVLMPFGDSTFDNILCIEVLEHAVDPELLISEMARVVRPCGQILLTVPWSARRHHLPHDYHRFTRERLQALLTQGGFTCVEIYERGNDICVIANKLTVLVVRMLRGGVLSLFFLPLGLLCGVLAAGFIVAAHLSVALQMGSKEDPLGYFVRARRAS